MVLLRQYSLLPTSLHWPPWLTPPKGEGQDLGQEPGRGEACWRPRGSCKCRLILPAPEYSAFDPCVVMGCWVETAQELASAGSWAGI